MEIVLNFDKKELVIKESSNVEELYKRLKDLLKKDLKNWEIVSDVVYQNNDWWYYKPYRTYPWKNPVWADTTTGTATYTNGTVDIPSSGVYCLSSDSTTADYKITN